MEENQIKLDELPEPRMRFTRIQGQDVLKFQKAFGYSREDIEKVIKVMAESGKEPIGSMGFDSNCGFERKPQHLSSYFKQLFAQVTNPPIDPIRERLVMSLTTIIGGNGNLLTGEKICTQCNVR